MYETFLGIRKYELEKDRYYINYDGKIYDLKRDTFIKSHLNTGYKRVSLRTLDNEQKSYYVHVLLAITYLTDESENKYVNHKDGDKLNNTVHNLEWVTHRENMKHAIENNLIKNKTSYSEKDVRSVCELLEEGKTAEYIEDKTGMNKSSVYSIRDGSNWVDISSQYKIKRTTYSKLNEETVHMVCERISEGEYLTSISRDLNIPYPTIGSIKQKVSWTHISDKYF